MTRIQEAIGLGLILGALYGAAQKRPGSAKFYPGAQCQVTQKLRKQ